MEIGSELPFLDNCCTFNNFLNFCILAREGELRQLRKQTTELEEQNAILSKHIESMKHAIEKLEIEAVQQRSTNMALQGHLDNLRTTLTDNFNSVPLPGEWRDLLRNFILQSSFKFVGHN